MLKKHIWPTILKINSMYIHINIYSLIALENALENAISLDIYELIDLFCCFLRLLYSEQPQDY